MRLIVWVVILSVASALVSVGVTVFVLLRLPADYFCRERRTFSAGGPLTAGRVALLLLKNLAGWLLVVLGIVLSVPGVPGQGLLTVLMGLMLVDFPGKYRLERWIVRRGPVRKGIDAVRKRYGREPFRFPEGG
jgi:hypothetical protein